jgi:hypothetical protein
MNDLTLVYLKCETLQAMIADLQDGRNRFFKYAPAEHPKVVAIDNAIAMLDSYLVWRKANHLA